MITISRSVALADDEIVLSNFLFIFQIHFSGNLISVYFHK